jgi:hypothetical protein
LSADFSDFFSLISSSSSLDDLRNTFRRLFFSEISAGEDGAEDADAVEVVDVDDDDALHLPLSSSSSFESEFTTRRLTSF